MKNVTLINSLLAFSLATSLVGATAQAQPTAARAEPDIETVGTGTRRIPPDRAAIHVTVQSRAASAAAAASANATIVQAVIDTLRRAGLDSMVVTAAYHVNPEYVPPRPATEPMVQGYVARSTLRVRPPRIDMVGRVIDASFAKGATGVEGITFESSKVEDARREALAEAAAAARRDAEALARALGGSLGALLSTSTVGADDSRRINVSHGEVLGMGMASSITPTEIVVSAAVVTRWRFVPR